jgi:hypothetical protein
MAQKNVFPERKLSYIKAMIVLLINTASVALSDKIYERTSKES